jgi:cleavage and polyadenylation specificity factor subunit 2
VLSHADHAHLAALPLIQGKPGNLAKPIPILCTLPVHKFGQMLLYDLFMNRSMEGTTSSPSSSSLPSQVFDLDDVDRAFENVHTVKYCQQISLLQLLMKMNLSPAIDSLKYSDLNKIFLCAYASGGTIGGAMWRIRYGHAEIQYAMDIYLKKELVLNGAALEMLPSTSPSLMIVEAGGLSTQHYPTNMPSVSTSKKDREDSLRHVLASVMITLRDGGNVLIPCETAGRSLEYLQHFAKYWYENKLGLYHLIFLSHMATTTFEYAFSQLEWMNDQLARAFYNGKPNPFDLKPLKLLTSIREIDRYPGPKVVFATDVSLSYGLSKELLLRWAGDPKNKVVFLDYAHEGSVAYEIRKQLQTPPIVVTLSQPKRVELVDEELINYRREKERLKRQADAALQRQLLLKELNLLDIDRESDHEDEQAMMAEEAEAQAQQMSSSSSSKRVKLQSSTIHCFTEPRFTMFQTQLQATSISEFGMNNHDLQFKDISPAYLMDNQQSNQRQAQTRPLPSSSTTATAAPTTAKSVTAAADLSSIPHKIISVTTKLQLTCQFYEAPFISGKADLKAIRSLIAKVNPSSILVLRGREVDCDQVLSYTLAHNIRSNSLANNTSISYTFQADRLRMHIIQSLLPANRKIIQSAASSNAADQSTVICKVHGIVGENPYESGRDGLRVVRLLDNSQLGSGSGLEEVQEDEEESKGGEYDQTVDETMKAQHDDVHSFLDVDQATLPVTSTIDDETTANTRLGPAQASAISIGEIMLDKLKSLLESKYNLSVEFRLGASGAMLICGGSTIVRKENENDFLIEGAPGPTYYAVRRAIYQQIAFI